ncbi:Chloroperoxidase [Cantharellus anzutake]|uniref:Chloroperoxidase n=1 Tax=Cantharellus anzutake TaxID=1750568 RepID=UPI0019074FD8|nr:Chloroperoxidase [Cantharellus anzutake]KAF8332681.1 Chloroperoxidase [Cantharellus anzutake]
MGDHPFISPGPGDLRSPCPALNTLANHGYIPRDGRNLHFWQLVKIQTEVFNISTPLAVSLAFEAIFLCGNGMTCDMKQLRKHNHIEHDASLSRLDAPGNSWSRNPHLIHEMMFRFSSPKGLTFNDIAKVRVAREKLLRTKTGRLDFFHNRIALGEACLVIGVWGEGGGEDFSKRTVSTERIRSFFLEERFPADWRRPTYQLGFLQTVNLGGQLRAIMDSVINKERSDATSGKLVRRTVTFDGVDYELSHSHEGEEDVHANGDAQSHVHTNGGVPQKVVEASQ